MSRCPNCGQEITNNNDYCQHCHYPLFEDDSVRQLRAQVWARKQVDKEEERARIKAEREAKEIKKREEVERLARKQIQEEEKRAKEVANREVKEKAKREAEEAKKWQEAERLARKYTQKEEKKAQRLTAKKGESTAKEKAKKEAD